MVRDANYWDRWMVKRLGRRRALKAAGAVGLGFAALTVACRGERGQPGPAPSETGALPAPGQGGSLRLHDNGDPASLDYVKTWAYRSMMPSSFVYPRLLKFDTRPGIGPIDYAITTDLAAAMPEQPDGTTYIFKLRPAVWEDRPPLNGRALTSDDILKNWERFVTEHPMRGLLTEVDKVEAPARDTVKFTLSKPLSPFVNHIGHQGVFYIQPPELLSGGQLEKDMWSAGPFLFRGYEVGSRIKFERNPNYFIKDRPLLREVTFEIIPDTSTTISALRSKQLDALAYAAVVLANDVDSVRRGLPEAVITETPRQVNNWVGFDLTDRRFQDKRVRQAVSMALNRDDLLRVGGKGMWVLPYGVLTQYYFDPKQNAFPNAKYYHHNLQEARALLDAAGIRDLGTHDMIASNILTPSQLQLAQLIQQQLRTIGLNTNIKQLEFAQYYALAVVAGRWQGGLAAGSNLVGADPNEYFSVLWAPDSPRLIAPGLKDLLERDTELLNLFEAQKRELDNARRKAIIRDVVNVMADRMYNVPYTTDMVYHVRQGYVKNMNYIYAYSIGNEYVLDTYIQM